MFGTEEHGTLGYMLYSYSGDIFTNLIDPLLEGLSEISFWVYSPYFEHTTGLKKEPTFDRPLFKSNSTLEMTEDIFFELYKEIFNESVFEYLQGDGVTYMTYSQRVPSYVQDRKDIQFYLFLIQDKQSVLDDQTQVQ